VTTKGRDAAFIEMPERTLFSGYKSLADEIIARGLYTAENISPSSPLKFNWKCAVCKKLIKNVSVASRTSAIDQARGTRGCPVCAKRSPGKRQPGVLLSAWMRDECKEEPGLTPPDQLYSDSRELRCWCCHKCWFVFSATVAARNAQENPQQCPNCTRFKKLELVDLTDKRHVRLAKLFVKDPRNTGYVQLRKKLPIEHRVYWKCEKGHVRYIPFIDVLCKRGCVTCYEQKHKGETLESSAYKSLYKQFVGVVGLPSFERQDVPANSHSLHVIWQCQNSNSSSNLHRWSSTPARRTGTKPFAGCPYCASKRVVVAGSLAELYPDLAIEWNFDGNEHLTKAKKITPDEVLPTDTGAREWICMHLSSDHPPYQASCKARTERGVGCPRCLVLVNCLNKTNPEVAAEWHHRLNEDSDLTPFNVTAGSMRKVHWQCQKNKKHKWEAVIRRRAKEGTGCPHCDGKTMIKANTLSGAYEQLVPHYHPIKNPKAASATLAGLNKSHWWHCFGCKKPYKRIVRSMLERGAGCLSCRAAYRIRAKLGGPQKGA